MNVLLSHHLPFMLAHGGLQIQIEQTRAGLEQIGVPVEYQRWWDPAQKVDIIHHFGRLQISILRFAQSKGVKLVLAELLTAQGSRSSGRLALQRLATRGMQRFLPELITGNFNWESYRAADACLANTSWEAHLMHYLFGAPKTRIHVVPNGVEEVFFNSKASERSDWLVCTATITERKRVLELAQAAVHARVPVWIIGRPYADSAPYYTRFLELARREPKFVRYEGGISDRGKMAQVYRQARGFVLLSTMETLSLSAGEAAACECPLLLSDLPWARSGYASGATFCPITSVPETAKHLRAFYDAAPGLPRPAKPPTWADVARQLEQIYKSLLEN